MTMTPCGIEYDTTDTTNLQQATDSFQRDGMLDPTMLRRCILINFATVDDSLSNQSIDWSRQDRFTSSLGGRRDVGPSANEQRQHDGRLSRRGNATRDALSGRVTLENNHPRTAPIPRTDQQGDGSAETRVALMDSDFIQRDSNQIPPRRGDHGMPNSNFAHVAYRPHFMNNNAQSNYAPSDSVDRREFRRQIRGLAYLASGNTQSSDESDHDSA